MRGCVFGGEGARGARVCADKRCDARRREVAGQLGRAEAEVARRTESPKVPRLQNWNGTRLSTFALHNKMSDVRPGRLWLCAVLR